MFGELPKLFDRNFVVGFILPSGILITISSIILQNKISFDAWNILEKDFIAGGVIFTAITFFIGVLLLAINSDLYRFFEGYGKYNPLRIFGWIEKSRYRNIKRKIKILDEEYILSRKKRNVFSIEKKYKRAELMKKLVEEFPDKEELLLPTAFGNTLRAFEIYPRVMYGIEGIDGWNRLLAVIPKDYLENIDGAKAQVDFWINLRLISLVFITEEIFVSIYSTSQISYLTIFICLLSILISSWRGLSSAKEWGDYVKSAFDMFNFDMLEKLVLVPPLTRAKQRELWTQFSQSTIYRLPDYLPKINTKKRLK